jgi:hypothetical protein
MRSTANSMWFPGVAGAGRHPGHAGARLQCGPHRQWGFNQLRDALFARVGQHAVRQLAYKTFVHMHKLSLRFTWNGAPAVCRASSSAAPRASRSLSVSPFSTRADHPRVCADRRHLRWTYGWSYVAIIATSPSGCTSGSPCAPATGAFPSAEMNQSDTDANTKAIDACSTSKP